MKTTIILLLVALTPLLAWDPNAGVIAPISENATISATSTHPGSYPENIIDGDEQTFWISSGCLPTGFYTRPDLNILLGLTLNEDNYSASALSMPASITDGNPVHTASAIYPVSGQAWFELYLPEPTTIHQLGTRLYLSTAHVEITVNTANGYVPVAIVSQSNTLLRFDLPEGPISSIRLSSTALFQIYELATLIEPPFESITLDFGTVKDVGWIYSRHFSRQNVERSTLLYSDDGVDWTHLSDLDNQIVGMVLIRPDVPIYARYLKIRHDLDDTDNAKAFVWELTVYDSDGPYVLMPTPKVNPHSMAELLGVNAPIGWGVNYIPDSGVLSENEGPILFSRVANHGRCYHNWRRDLVGWDPANNPPLYQIGWSTGDYWLREYTAWSTPGLEVEATIQFVNLLGSNGEPTSATLMEEEFDANGDGIPDPYEYSYDYGQAFANFFGSATPDGNDIAKTIEVGNEPWGYEPEFYRDILYGMARGVKDTDPNMVVLPCALQAYKPESESHRYYEAGFIGTRLSERELPYIDGLNIHTYSFTKTPDGTRIAVNPEHPESFMNSVRNMIQFRDVNAPDLPIYLTEWGWDGGSELQECLHSECVSEEAQALYAVRGALMFAREGLDRLTWFFYSNLPYEYNPMYSGKSIFYRSGYTNASPDMRNLQPKKSFIAMEALLNTIGDLHFVDVLQEDENAWVYLLGDEAGTPTHVVAWRPVDVDRDMLGPVDVNVAVNGVPGNAWTLAGLSSVGEPVDAPPGSIGSWDMTVTEVPVVIEIIQGPASIAGTVAVLGQGVDDVIVDLYNNAGDLLDSKNTDQQGKYEFTELDGGLYVVSMIVPLGYVAVTPVSVNVEINPGESYTVNFSLLPKDIIVDCRGSGFWKHQVKAHLSGKGKAHYTESEMIGFLNSIMTFWDYFDFVDVSLEGLQQVLDLSKKPSMKQKAEKEFMTLLLNVASEKIATFTVISEDDNVNDALDYAHLLLTDSQSSTQKLEELKDLLECLNNGDFPIDKDLVPENLGKRIADWNQSFMPTEFALYQNFPNPFNPTTQIMYDVPEQSLITIDIYNALGQHVKSLVNSEQLPGQYNIMWDGTNEDNRQLGAGIYLCRMSGEQFNKTLKLVLVR